MPFDPREHLTKLQGKDYLEVRWRLAWLREAHPTAVITTELVAYDVAQEWAIVRATVTLPDGGGSATGMVFQRPTGIAKDWVANGETSAIGRALGALGFGTQFAQEFDQGDQVVDSPVVRQTTSASAGAPIAPLPAANLARPEPVAEPDADLAAAREELRAAMTTRGMKLSDLLALVSKALPHITDKASMETLTAFQVRRVTEIVTGESVVAQDERGAWRIMPRPALVTELAAAVK